MDAVGFIGSFCGRCFRKRRRGKVCGMRMGLDRTSVEGVAAVLEMLMSGSVDVQLLKDTVIAPSASEVIAAFAGGTVGVMGSLTVFEKRLQEVRRGEERRS